ncbi:MAG TPA: rod-binding protein [Methylomusa anaerophila]|uniref:Peptidoglycan hydrolase FlgJ n=1 Tax=Methylomusa anaerophila TaxID=1930071 RepID=A0A348AKE4_9FIRM|nr:rod-binding protein [Methylomusa anaerophila]BBB91542.1 peptidoglycan hydrolase FlgJ [Methylomusa anaerophila]HML89520.1 rod-binding protein [Methylomusa anaerophila]
MPLRKGIEGCVFMQISGVDGSQFTNSNGALERAKVQSAVEMQDGFAAKLERAVGAGGGTGGQNTNKEGLKLKQACRDMEAVFLNIMLTRMRATVPKSGLLGDNKEENIYQSLLDTELTKNMAQAGGIGLADMLYRQLSPAKYSGPKGQVSR